MKQPLKSTMAAAAAAGLTAMALTAAAPAANEGDSKDVGRAKVVQSEGPTPEALTSCLSTHGATGVPAADEGAGRALKEWIAAHQEDASVRSALKACDVYFADEEPKQGASDGALTCRAPANAEATAAEKRAVASGAPAARE